MGCYACPPLFVGIGIGGSFDSVALLAKEALLRSPKQKNRDAYYRSLEEDIRRELNKSNIGPMGLGGEVTVLQVAIEGGHIRE